MLITAAAKPLKTCILASSNQGKLKEFEALLQPLGIHLAAQSQFNVQPCEEPYATFLENALEKARHASRHTGFAALADDSGLCVPALGGAPGVLSARFAQSVQFTDSSEASLFGATGSTTDALNCHALIDQLKQLKPPASRGTFGVDTFVNAFYVCVLVYVRFARDPQPLVAQAVWHGQVTDKPVGDGGFGYDSYFYLPKERCTVAQLSIEQKNAVSHRARALKALQAQLLESISGDD